MSRQGHMVYISNHEFDAIKKIFVDGGLNEISIRRFPYKATVYPKEKSFGFFYGKKILRNY
jgi:hypothetical protein